MWRLSKEAIKSSWNTRVNGSVNPKLLQGVRVFQWRWHHSDKGDMMSVTGHALKKLRLSWNEKKRRAVGRVYPVKTNRSWKCTFKIPGIFDYLCDHKMATAPQRQPHSNWKIAQPLARFPPRRDVYDVFGHIYGYIDGYMLVSRYFGCLGQSYTFGRVIMMQEQQQEITKCWAFPLPTLDTLQKILGGQHR